MKQVPVIRPMRIKDLDAVMAIEVQVFEDTWSRNSYEFEINKNKYSLPMVMELREEIIGYAVAWLVFDEYHIATIAIAPAYQGQGWGRYLLQAMLGMADGAEFAMLEVRPSNERAIRLYQEMGFTEVGLRRQYYRNGEDALIMRKNLI